MRAAGEDAQRAALAAGRLAQAIARLQHQPQLDQRVRDVGVRGALDRLVAGDRAAAGALGGGEAPVGAQRDRPLVGRMAGISGSSQASLGVEMLGMAASGRGIVPSRTGMSPRPRRSVPEVDASSRPR